MRFKSYFDINYGIGINYPQGWERLYYMIPNLIVFSNKSRDSAVFSYILSKTEESENEENLLSFIGSNIFQSESARAILTEAKKGDFVTFQGYFKEDEDPEKFYFKAIVKEYKHEVNGFNFSEKVLFGVTYHEKSEPTEEPIKHLIEKVSLLVEKKPSPMGFNVPFTHYVHKVRLSHEYEKWSIFIPITWEILPKHDDFIAKAGGCVAGVYSFIATNGEKPKDFLAEVNANIIAKELNIGEIKKKEFKCDDEKCTFLGETRDGAVRFFSIINRIDRIHEKGDTRTFHIYKFAAYPTWLEPHFLPIATASLLTWQPGPYYLYELLGGKYPETMTVGTHITQIKSVTPSRQKRTAPKKISKGPSETYKRFREKLKEDMKKMIDWEKNLWDSTYQTLKMSDTITSTYTLEDRYGKSKLVYTDGLASPTTHRFWRHKEDPTWQETWATKKPFVPKIKTNWEELKWKWEEEQKRLKKETEEKKKKIDEMFK